MGKIKNMELSMNQSGLHCYNLTDKEIVLINQQLAVMREEVLYVIFLDLSKAYNALDRSRSL